MYHNKKEMGMGGRNMPKLMKKGGKSSFPDLNNDGKVSFADILAGRIGKKKKKSMEHGGRPGRMKEMKRLYVGSPYDVYSGPIRRTDDYLDRLYDLEDQRYPLTDIVKGSVDEVANPEKYVVLDARDLMAYGGKVKLMKKGGTVDYFAGGALAAGLGQFAQRSQNPLIQGIGKVASTVGGMTPGGRAVNMAANFLPAGLGALGQLMRGR